MNLQQLRIVRETVRRNFNLTEVASVLATSQSGVSKHIKDLEGEIGLELFVRHGKRLLGLTEPGKEVLQIVERILLDTSNLQQLGEQFTNREQGQVVIATTHTQARYVLPQVIGAFKKIYCKIRLMLHQGSPAEIVFASARGPGRHRNRHTCRPGRTDGGDIPFLHLASQCRRSQGPCVGEDATAHPRCHRRVADPHLQRIVSGRANIDETFEKAGLFPDIVMSAMDIEVIKTYVEYGLGIGIIAGTAFDQKRDAKLRLLDGSHLFEGNTVRIAVRRGSYLQELGPRFIELCAPSLNEAMIRAAVTAS